MSRLDELLTADEVAELMHIPRSTVSNSSLICAGGT
jgi:plasmid maintenance system antidote protein VapI